MKKRFAKIHIEKGIKKCFAVIMAGAVVVTGGVLPQGKMVSAAADYGISNPRIENGVTTWDKIKFGSYYQDAGFEPEPIKWRVLSVNGDDAFLLADKILDCKQYNEEWADVTWETCTLRKWLNEDFYNEVFDVEEKAAITETTVINNDTIYVNYAGEEEIIEGGNDTKDKIYLLSADEVVNEVYGFDSTGTGSMETRYAKNTDYARLNGAYTYKGDDIYYTEDFVGNGDWLLRSPGSSSSQVSDVSYPGSINSIGFDVDHIEGVRPVLHVNLSSSEIKDAGEVDSVGNITSSSDGVKAPRVNNGITTWDCVYFGSYKQNAKFEKKQDIEWRVLSIDGDDAFILADKNLDCKPYDERFISVTWETCMLRRWLNEEFYNETFDAEEKTAIMETIVINNDTIHVDFRDEEEVIEGGNDTKDKIYILSIDEVNNEAYGFDSREKRSAKNTDYARLNGATRGSDYVENGHWWLRSPGWDNKYASVVSDDGIVYNDADNSYVDNEDYAIRPVLHIDLSSSVWSKSGEVYSGEWEDEPMTTEAPTPTQTKEPTETPTEKPEQKPDASQGQPTETPVPSSTGIGNTPPDINNANVPSAGNVDTAVQSPAAAKILSAKNTKKGKVVIKWNKSADVNGYEIQYSNNMKFKKAKKKNTSNNKYTIKKLKKKKVYYIRLRAYKVVNGVKIYSSWSKVKKVKIRK